MNSDLSQSEMFDSDYFNNYEEQKEALYYIFNQEMHSGDIESNKITTEFIDELLEYFQTECSSNDMMNVDEPSDIFWEKCYKRKSQNEDTQEDNRDIILLEQNSNIQILHDEISDIVQDDFCNNINNYSNCPICYSLLQFDGDLLICETDNCINFKIPYKGFNLNSFVNNLISAK